MIDAKPDLRRDIRGITVDADVSRQVDAGIRILQRQKRTSTIAHTTVFGLGTNGTGTLTIGASGIVATSSNVQTTSLVQGRAPSWIATISVCGDTASNPFHTESCRSAPPATNRNGFRQ